jgi:hypothetical protein
MDASQPRRLQSAPRPLIRSCHKLKTPPRTQRSVSWEHLKAAKPLRNRGALQVVQQIDLPRSPKRKVPRVGQKSKQNRPTPVRRPKLLPTPGQSPSPQSAFPGRFNMTSAPIDDVERGFSVPSFVDSGIGPSSPQGSDNEDEFDLAEAVSQIESQQATQLPDYRELLLWNPESYARLTNRCYIIQDWSPRERVLQVRVPY